MSEVEIPARQRIVEALTGVEKTGSFSSRRTAPVGDLALEIDGVGLLDVPTASAQARKVIAVCKPAQYGKGEQTLLDPAVRDTWQVPLDRVRIDEQRWDRTLRPILDQMVGDLGLPAGARLVAELHSMLVYSRGQFFAPHRDSEKVDDMVASLVVTLPGTSGGGELVIEHAGERAVYKAVKDELSFVGFYADCLHEVRPVKSGHRVVLTYNLLLSRAEIDRSAAASELDVLVPALLNEHFTKEIPSEWRDEMTPPPRRFVYLLDHQYTQRGLAWSRLKGVDAERADLLRAAAERADCTVTLVLAEVKEVRDCQDDGWGYRRRPWSKLDPENMIAGELIDNEITLAVNATTGAAPLLADVCDDELCESIPSSDLEPYGSDYEGYMGNYGNIMERWYRRAAVVIWQRSRSFLVHAEASPTWAVAVLENHLAAGDVAAAQSAMELVLPFWDKVARGEQEPNFVGSILRVAVWLDRFDLAETLLRPLRVEVFTVAHVPDLTAIAARYGDERLGALVDGWFPAKAQVNFANINERSQWVTGLPTLCAASTDTQAIAHHLLRRTWAWLEADLGRALRVSRPSGRASALTALAAPIVAFLAAADADELRDAAITTLCADDATLDLVLEILRVANAPTSLREHAVQRLTARLALPVRAADDWSITGFTGCGCELCATLAAFLISPARHRLDWPIREESRRHVHGLIDAGELPLTHVTQRTGRPYTLILGKAETLFTRESQARATDEAMLARLKAPQVLP